MQIEGLSYVILHVGQIMPEMTLIDCPRIKLDRHNIFPLFMYQSVEQGWLEGPNMFIGNKYAHY